ncbi:MULTISPECIES: ABC transporter ATP-binding protein [Stappiaceae]|jgi:branched-chain amino acid transport system ATP-binding protein|uniref:Branched-chain amino acid ABC transporter, ATP-binding protein n=1 Tax=Roseibium aggregatum (strain ATCC 25650 / DSM 13394 / JCM 20685 / NBRC 16684 / NCIMB 2208 / IAM 12614 / B1) TaxID=384765 RepID=A0P132_ROSAI|nr:branched-chain amino acid ABC transporter, ATP-binding protein [Stappia aggregata IAM 12614] [Roseibium aggregatum IAM 12614]
MPMPDALLSTKALEAHYGDFQALFGISIDVQPAEVVAIIGANGAGKTTLMRSITGLIRNKPEMVVWKGRAIGALRADQVAHLGIAMVPEGRQLFQSLSVEENLMIGGQMGRKGPWTLKTVQDLFPLLQERRHVPATALSGGQQQMVAIGRALMSNPDILLFDEISLGLAPIVIKSIYEALPAIIGEGMSAIIVEQDIAKAVSVSHRVYCLQEGRVSLQGRPDELTREAISAAYFGV